MHVRSVTACLLVGACILSSISARADSLSDIFTQGHVDGELRTYYFSRLFGAPNTTDANALSAAALINFRSGTFADGFSLGASFLTANSLGTQSGNPAAVDTSLMGPNNSISSLGQAYLQYQNDRMQVRAGYQYLNTPWMGSSDSRVLPASYNAVSAVFKPMQGWDIYALRSFEWKGRTANGYHSDNNYYPPTYRGDSSYGGFGGLPATATQATGAWALGTAYGSGGFKAQAWYYDFLQFARMAYIDGSYTFKTGTGFDPFIAAQYDHETGGSDNKLIANRVALLGVAGTRIKNNTWGTDVGVNIPNGKVEAGYNKISREAGAVGNGALISPYSAGYATDPLYTTSMIRGLVEQGPGHAWKTKLTYGFLANRLVLMTAYTRYTTIRRGNSHNVYVDLAYNFDGYLKGLSVRDRWERAIGGLGLNPGNGSFVYNRVMIAYKF